MNLVSRTHAARLRALIVFDIAISVAAALFTLVVYLVAVDSPYLLALTGIVAGTAGVMTYGLRPLGRGNVRAAMAWLASANWFVAMVTAAVATFAWPLLMLAALFPSVLAAAFVTGRQLAFYVTTSMVVALAVLLLAQLQDFSGFTAEVPSAIQRAVLIIFTPLVGVTFALVALQNSLRLQAALAAAIDAQEATAEHAEELRRSRARVVAATDRERRRIERDLHDGAQQRLIAIGIGLTRAKALCDTDPPAAVDALESLRRELRVARDELRDLAQGVYPPVLSEHGLREALRSAADRCSLDVSLALDDVGRHHPDMEAAIYFCCVEALQNAVKHSQSPSVTVSIGIEEADLWFAVRDDGVGFDDVGTTGGSGIVNMRDRLGAMGGELLVASARGRGTHVRGRIPLTT